MNDFFASLNRVEERFVEIVRSSIDELHKIVLSNSVYHIVSILFWDVHVIIFHLGASEDGHGRFD